MKKIYFGILVIVAFTSCKQKTADELIAAKWKCVEIDISKLEGYASNMSDKLSIEMLRSKYKESTAQFYKDKTYEQSIITYNYKENGQYKLINDGKYLICNHLDFRNNEKEEKFEILTITDDSLKLISEDNYIISFIKEK